MATVSKAIRDSLDELDVSITNLKNALRQRRSDESAEIRRYKRETEGLDDRGADSVPDGSVRELDVGRYKDLQDREVPRDGTQHDHIPSKAALARWAERYLQARGRRLTPEMRERIEADGISVEISDALHRLSRTYGGRQNRVLPLGDGTGRQIDVDASDLDRAMWRDLATLWENIDRTRPDLDKNDVLDAIQEIVDSNHNIESRLGDLLDGLNGRR